MGCKTVRILVPAIVLAFCGCFSVAAQQITRVAVLDLPKVVALFSREAAPVKEFEKRKADVQADVDRRSAEIRALQAQKSEADSTGDAVRSSQIAADIAKKMDDLREFVKTRQAELDAMARDLGTASGFLKFLNQVIAQVAEAEGYSIVLNLKTDDPASGVVLWYSHAVDLTDKVVQAISAKYR